MNSQNATGDGAHLSGLEADGLQGSEGQVALVGELGEPTDDSGTDTDGHHFLPALVAAVPSCKVFEQLFHPLALGSQ